MAFSEEDERILKLIANDVKAKMELGIANKTMGDAIRAEFSSIDARIRAEHQSTITPLQENVVTAKSNLQAEFE